MQLLPQSCKSSSNREVTEYFMKAMKGYYDFWLKDVTDADSIKRVTNKWGESLKNCTLYEVQEGCKKSYVFYEYPPTPAQFIDIILDNHRSFEQTDPAHPLRKQASARAYHLTRKEGTASFNKMEREQFELLRKHYRSLKMGIESTLWEPERVKQKQKSEFYTAQPDKYQVSSEETAKRMFALIRKTIAEGSAKKRERKNRLLRIDQIF
jgi:hypothetical protein